VSAGTVKERLLRELTSDYEPAIDPDDVDLKMKVSLLCSWLDNGTGFVVSHGWEFYVSICSYFTYRPITLQKNLQKVLCAFHTTPV